MEAKYKFSSFRKRKKNRARGWLSELQQAPGWLVPPGWMFFVTNDKNITVIPTQVVPQLGIRKHGPCTPLQDVLRIWLLTSSTHRAFYNFKMQISQGTPRNPDVAAHNQPFSTFKSDSSPASSDWPNKAVELTGASLSNGIGRPGKLPRLLFPPFATSVPEQKCCKPLREHS